MTGKVKSKLAAHTRGPKRIVVPEATILPTRGRSLRHEHCSCSRQNDRIQLPINQTEGDES
jgi:hypothetical protein